MPEDLLASVGVRVHRMARTGDLSAVFDPEAKAQAQQLAGTLARPETDLEPSRVVLTWWYWFCYCASSDGDDELDLAVELAVPCLLVGVDAFPDQLLPMIASVAVAPAITLLRDATRSPSAESATALIDLWRRITAAIPEDDPSQRHHQTFLSAALMMRFETGGDPADLDAGVEASMAALAVAAVHDRHNPRFHYEHGRIRLARYRVTGDRMDLNSAAEALMRAVEIGEPQQVDADLLVILGGELRAHFTNINDVGALSAALAAFHLALLATETDAEIWPMLVSEISSGLLARYEASGLPEDLDRLVDLLSWALPISDAEEWTYVYVFALLLRFERAANPEDLDAAAAFSEPVADLVATDWSSARWLALRGNILKTRFEERGDPADLTAAIEMHRRALCNEQWAWSAGLNGYANALRTRYELTGDMADLQESIAAQRRMADAHDLTDSDRAMLCSNLALALVARFERTAERPDLDEAVELHRRAIAAVEPAYYRWAMFQSNLGGALLRRYRLARTNRTWTPPSTRCAPATRPPCPTTATWASICSISAARCSKAMCTASGGGPAELLDAEQAFRDALGSMADDHPDRATVHFMLGEVLRCRGDDAQDAAVAEYIRAAQAPTIRPMLRIQAYNMASWLVKTTDPGCAARSPRPARLLSGPRPQPPGPCCTCPWPCGGGRPPQ